MKEWCLKHPIMTFLLIDSAICSLENLVIGKIRAKSITNTITKKSINWLREHSESEDDEPEKQPIGFVKR